MAKGSSIALIIGLKNPGSRYENTRHNAGAWFAEPLGINYKLEKSFEGLLAPACNDASIKIFLPETYMNESGRAVRKIADYFKLAPDHILIAHDEIDLPPGIARLKLGGGHGGHNGLRDIISHLKTPNFYRLRIGVGHPGHKDDVADHVLKAPSKKERIDIDCAIDKANQALALFLKGEREAAVKHLHTD